MGGAKKTSLGLKKSWSVRGYCVHWGSYREPFWLGVTPSPLGYLSNLRGAIFHPLCKCGFESTHHQHPPQCGSPGVVTFGVIDPGRANSPARSRPTVPEYERYTLNTSQRCIWSPGSGPMCTFVNLQINVETILLCLNNASS